MPRHSLTPLQGALACGLLASMASGQTDRAADPIQRALQRAESTGRPTLMVVAPARGSTTSLDETDWLALRRHVARRAAALQFQKGKLALPKDQHTARREFALALHSLLLSSNPDVLRLLLDAQLVVVERSDLPRPPRDGAARETMVLTTPSGAYISGAIVDLHDEAAVARATTRMMDGFDRSVERRNQGDPVQTRAVMRALQALRDDDAAGATPLTTQQERQHIQSLAGAYSTHAPMIHGELAAAIGPYRDRLRSVLDTAIQMRGGRGQKLPFGMSWENDAQPVDPCPACGMAIQITDLSRRLLINPQ